MSTSSCPKNPSATAGTSTAPRLAQSQDRVPSQHHNRGSSNKAKGKAPFHRQHNANNEGNSNGGNKSHSNNSHRKDHLFQTQQQPQQQQAPLAATIYVVPGTLHHHVHDNKTNVNPALYPSLSDDDNINNHNMYSTGLHPKEQQQITTTTEQLANFAAHMATWLLHGHMEPHIINTSNVDNFVPKALLIELYHHILEKTRLSTTVVLLSLKYINQLVHNFKANNLVPLGNEVADMQIAIAAMNAASKFLSEYDTTITNAGWANIIGVSVHTINTIEISLLESIDYRLFTSGDQFLDWLATVAYITNNYIPSQYPLALRLQSAANLNQSVSGSFPISSIDPTLITNPALPTPEKVSTAACSPLRSGQVQGLAQGRRGHRPEAPPSSSCGPGVVTLARAEHRARAGVPAEGPVGARTGLTLPDTSTSGPTVQSKPSFGHRRQQGSQPPAIRMATATATLRPCATTTTTSAPHLSSSHQRQPQPASTESEQQQQQQMQQKRNQDPASHQSASRAPQGHTSLPSSGLSTTGSLKRFLPVSWTLSLRPTLQLPHIALPFTSLKGFLSFLGHLPQRFSLLFSDIIFS